MPLVLKFIHPLYTIMSVFKILAWASSKWGLPILRTHLRDLLPVPLLEALLGLPVGAVLLLGVVVREVGVGRRPLRRLGRCGRGCCCRRRSGGRGRLLLRKVHGYLNVPGFGLYACESWFNLDRKRGIDRREDKRNI